MLDEMFHGTVSLRSLRWMGARRLQAHELRQSYLPPLSKALTGQPGLCVQSLWEETRSGGGAASSPSRGGCPLRRELGGSVDGTRMKLRPGGKASERG